MKNIPELDPRIIDDHGKLEDEELDLSEIKFINQEKSDLIAKNLLVPLIKRIKNILKEEAS